MIVLSRLALLAPTVAVLFSAPVVAQSWRNRWTTTLNARHGFAIVFPAFLIKQINSWALRYPVRPRKLARTYAPGTGRMGTCDE